MSRISHCGGSGGKLAIVSIDLAGYSRLMEEDEQGTHRALMTCRHETLEPIVSRHDGRIIKSTGDGALITFPTADGAVNGMIAFQKRVTAQEAVFPESRRLAFRAGIHVSEAIYEEGDLYGHGVNLAVRLQEAAEPGSIYLSDAVVEELQRAGGLDIECLGQRTFKNLKTPIPVYCLARKKTDRQARNLPSLSHQKKVVAAALIGIGVLVFPSGAMHRDGNERRTGPQVQRAGEGLGQSTEVDLKNSGEWSQERAGSVASERSNRDLIDQVEHYALVGRLSRSDNRIRVDVKPNEPLMSHRDWAERLGVGMFDRASLPTYRRKANAASAPSDMAPNQRSLLSRDEIADDIHIRAWMLYNRNTPEDFREAKHVLDEALLLAPGHDEAHALLAAVYWSSWQNKWQLGTGYTAVKTLQLAQDHLNRVRQPTAIAHVVTSEMLTASGHHDSAIAEAERAMLLEPSMAVGSYAKGLALLFDGRPEKAEGLIQTARRLDPLASRYLFGLALAQFSQERFEDAFTALSNATSNNAQDDWPFLLLAATSGYLGRSEDARHALGKFDQMSLPRRGWFATQVPYVHSWPFKQSSDRRRLHRGMIFAGIPDSVHLAAR